MLDQRGQLLRAPVGFAGCSMPSYDRALHALRTRLDSWAGIGHVAVGMHRQGYDLQLTQYDDRGWRRHVLHDRDGALTHQCDGHRMGAHALAGAADGQYLTDAKSMTGTVPANLPAAPIFKHPEQEDEAEGGVLVTIREDAPLDFRVRACNNRLGVRGGRRTSGRRAGSAHRNHTGGYEQYTHGGQDHSDTREPHLLALQVQRVALA